MQEIMAKGLGLYTEIGKKARDLLYKDYQSDHKFTVTTYSPTGVVSFLLIFLSQIFLLTS
ncbi:unnamed protein product [Camellia sinensis]